MRHPYSALGIISSRDRGRLEFEFGARVHSNSNTVRLRILKSTHFSYLHQPVEIRSNISSRVRLPGIVLHRKFGHTLFFSVQTFTPHGLQFMWEWGALSRTNSAFLYQWYTVCVRIHVTLGYTKTETKHWFASHICYDKPHLFIMWVHPTIWFGHRWKKLIHSETQCVYRSRQLQWSGRNR